jgi:hypothetical protein
MITFISRALAGTLLLASFAHAAGIGGPITVAPDIPYVRSTEAATQVLGSSCNWQKDFMAELVKLSRGQVSVSTTPDPAEQLHLRADLSASDRTGTKAQPQWIEIMGKLVRQGRTVGEFSFVQETDKQALSNCEAVRDIAKDLADNMYDWLKNPGAGVTIAAEIPMLNPDAVEPDVQASCPATRMLPQALTEETDGAVQRTTRDLATVGGRTLHLKIISSRLLGGAIYTGSKWIKVTGSLKEGQHEIGSFIAQRNTLRAWTSCGVVDSVSEEISEDIAKWLKKPSLNARLGNADEKTTAEP